MEKKEMDWRLYFNEKNNILLQWDLFLLLIYSDTWPTLTFQCMLVSRDGEYVMTGGDKGIVEVEYLLSHFFMPQYSNKVLASGLADIQPGAALRFPCVWLRHQESRAIPRPKVGDKIKDIFIKYFLVP